MFIERLKPLNYVDNSPGLGAPNIYGQDVDLVAVLWQKPFTRESIGVDAWLQFTELFLTTSDRFCLRCSFKAKQLSFAFSFDNCQGTEVFSFRKI